MTDKHRSKCNNMDWNDLLMLKSTDWVKILHHAQHFLSVSNVSSCRRIFVKCRYRGTWPHCKKNRMIVFFFFNIGVNIFKTSPELLSFNLSALPDCLRSVLWTLRSQNVVTIKTELETWTASSSQGTCKAGSFVGRFSSKNPPPCPVCHWTLNWNNLFVFNYENNQQDALCRLIYYSKSALHVSGYVFAHHQEHLTVFTVSGSVHPSCCRLVSWMSWNCKANLGEH